MSAIYSVHICVALSSIYIAKIFRKSCDDFKFLHWKYGCPRPYELVEFRRTLKLWKRPIRKCLKMPPCRSVLLLWPSLHEDIMGRARIWGFVCQKQLSKQGQVITSNSTQIAKLMAPTWDPPGSCRPQMGPMLAPWTLLSGYMQDVISCPCPWYLLLTNKS